MTPADRNGERTPEERERARLEREARRAGRQPPPAPAPQPPSAPPPPAGQARSQAPANQPPPTQPPPSGPPPSGPPRSQRPASAPTPPPRRPPRPRPPADVLASARSVLGSSPGGLGPDEPRSPRRTLAAYALIGGLLALLLLFLVLLYQPGRGPGGSEVAVAIPEGAGVGEIADLLADRNVISGPLMFQLRATIEGARGKLQPGTYTLREDMSYGAALDALTRPPPTPKRNEPVTVVVPEGRSRSEIAPIAADAGLDGDYMEATKGAKGFNPGKYDAKSADDLEGFLFPATYELRTGRPVDELVGQQLAAFEDNFSSVDLKDARKVNLTPYDVLTIASMVEREAVLDKERPLVASVIYNRLRDGIPLGIDATTRFETRNWTEPLTQSVLEADTPYNTRVNSGLPPGPIGNPGLASIKAAAKPAKTDYLYYVVKPGTCGEHAFSETDAQFQEDQERYNSARAAEGGQSPTDC